jgi:diguanylate cyclase (GGDEF)-like protein
MDPGSRSPTGGQSDEVLSAVAVGLAADAKATARKTVDVIRARSPELARLSEESGDELTATSGAFVDVLLASLRADADLPWAEYEQRARDHGHLKAAQGIGLDTLLDMLAIYRRAVIELITQPMEGSERRDEIVAVAQSRLENVVERLTTAIVRGYLEHLDSEHRSRESELYGLAAIVTAMGRSLDLADTAEVALVETLAALRLNAGAIWLRERAAFKLAFSAGLEADEVEAFAQQTGPQVRAAITAVGRSESRVDRGLDGDWNALRAQLRVKGRTVGVITVATRMPRVFGASDLLFVAAVADQIAIALDRARQFSSEARTDHLTGLANRREFERIMEREVALAERHGRKLSLMMIDLDNLKRINDRQGHRAGDAALRLVGQQVQRVVRASDLCARLGGDEFGVTMPETDLDRAREAAARLRSAVTEASLSARSPQPVRVSIGLAAWRLGQDWQATFQVADLDLYEDKRRQKEAMRAAPEQPALAIRLLARKSGKPRVGGN